MLGYRIILYFIFSGTFLFSQPTRVPVVTKYPDGSVKETGTYTGGKKNGIWLTFETTGKLKTYHTYKNDTLHGPYAEFDLYGQIKKEGFMRSGNPAGIEYQYDNGVLWKKIQWLTSTRLNDRIEIRIKESTYDLNTGRIRSEGFFYNGKKDSVWKYYDENAKLKATETLKTGKRHGVAERFYMDGALAERANFYEGAMHGIRLTLTTEGDTSEYGNYTNNVRDGHFIRKEAVAIPDLTADVKLFNIEGVYKNGKMDGAFILMHSNGTVAAKENYSNDRLYGERKLYNENGVLVFTCNYIMNRKNGVEKIYYNNGTLRQLSNYANGVIEGKQQIFFESGKLSEEISYEKGRVSKLIRYYENGKVRQKMFYKDGKLLKQESYDEKGKKTF
jgi:uncharacterized protein